MIIFIILITIKTFLLLNIFALFKLSSLYTIFFKDVEIESELQDKPNGRYLGGEKLALKLLEARLDKERKVILLLSLC